MEFDIVTNISQNSSNNFSCQNYQRELDLLVSSTPIVYYSVLTILLLIEVLILFGNSLVVLAVLTSKSLRTVTNYFIVSLAIADLLVAIFVLPLSIYLVATRHIWRFGVLICELWVSFDVMLCTASILNLCCISLDRYLAITRPLQYSHKRSPKLAFNMIAVVWIASILVCLPPLLGWKDPNRYLYTDTCYYNNFWYH